MSGPQNPTTAPALKNVIAARAAAAKAPSPAQSLIADIERFTPQISRLLPKSAKPQAERLTRVAIAAMRTDPELALCSPVSIAGTLATCAQLGLDPGYGGRAFLAPRLHEERGWECVFLLGYHGAIELFHRHPDARKLAGRPVKRGDKFEFQYGTGERDYFTHQPAENDDQGPSYKWYAVAATRDGGGGFEVYGPKDVARRRRRSGTPNSVYWAEDFDKMAVKSVFWELFTWLPAGRDLSLAMAQDGHLRTDLEPDALGSPAVETPDQDPGPHDEDGEAASDPSAAPGGQSAVPDQE